MQVTDGTSVTNMKPAIEEDATSDKKNLYTNFIYNEFACKYASWYIEKNGKKCQRI